MSMQSLKDKREEVSRLKSEIAVRELELRKLKELLQRAEMELQVNIASSSVVLVTHRL